MTTENQISIVALDPGFGNTKVCIEGKTAYIQSAVTRPKQIGKAGIGIKVSNHITHVLFDQHHFAVGPGSWDWGEPLGSLDYTSLASAEKKSLFYAVLAQLLEPGEYQIQYLMIGLPVPLLEDTSQSENILNSLKAYKGEHHFEVQGQRYHLSISRLKVLAQPVGAYSDWLIDSDLRVRKNGEQAEVAILDIGMNTLDLFVLQGGRAEPRFVGGAKVGARKLFTSLLPHGMDIEELDALFRSGAYHPTQSELAGWLGEVIGTMERSWANLRRFSAVIPVGGGALILDDLLRSELVAKGAAVYWADDPICANVRGLWKWGSRVVRYKS
jgi:hypothetical protein